MLTDTKVRTAKKQEKPYRLTDGNSLFLHVARSGNKTWRIRYVFKGKESQVVIGSYPDMSLAEARIRRDEIKKNLKLGINPILEKRIALLSETHSSQNNFQTVARN